MSARNDSASSPDRGSFALGSVHLNDVGPTVVVVIDECAAPGDVLVVDSDSRGKGHVAEGAVPIVVIKIAGVVREIRLENIEPAVTIVVRNTNPHACLLVSVL